MRQLDLFGSLFDPPANEEKLEESKPVVQQKEKSSAPLKTEETQKTYYSIVEVAEDFKEFGEVSNQQPIVERNDRTFSKNTLERTAAQEVVSPKATPTPLSKSEAIIEALSVRDINPLTSEPIISKSDAGEEVKVKLEGEEVMDAELISPKSLKSVKEPVINVPNIKIVENKKSTTRKTVKSKAPELETNGAVVFTDGKITVKIKNKNPFKEVLKEDEKAERKEKEKKVPQKRGRKSFKEIDAEVDLIEIPEDEILFQKQYYPISEVAKWFRVNTSLLRYWENEFDILKPRKNRKGDRLFRPEDIKNLQLIYQLLRQRKYTIDGAKEYIKTNKKKADLQLQLTNTLQKFKSFLLDLKTNLQV